MFLFQGTEQLGESNTCVSSFHSISIMILCRLSITFLSEHILNFHFLIYILGGLGKEHPMEMKGVHCVLCRFEHVTIVQAFFFLIMRVNPVSFDNFVVLFF